MSGSQKLSRSVSAKELSNLPDKASDIRVSAQMQDSFEVISGRADAGLIILCDHAENTLPERYGTLGLPQSQLQRHIAYDIGARAITESLCTKLGVPGVLSRFSRLLIDPNRGDDDPTLIMQLSDGAVIPGNRNLTVHERERRMELYYRPYHEAIDRVIDACLATGIAPAILSVHSFTESWKGVARPWHIGVLWDKDPRFAVPVLEALHAEQTLIVGDNEPYIGQLRGDCVWQHATERGLACALIEYRQDLVRDREGQMLWADRTARIVQSILADTTKKERLQSVEKYGSHTDFHLAVAARARRLATLHARPAAVEQDPSHARSKPSID
jgi:predicted N-formylglutamate amidohydrolase